MQEHKQVSSASSVTVHLLLSEQVSTACPGPQGSDRLQQGGCLGGGASAYEIFGLPIPFMARLGPTLKAAVTRRLSHSTARVGAAGREVPGEAAGCSGEACKAEAVQAYRGRVDGEPPRSWF